MRYLILELINGGELFDHIVKETRFSEPKARFYFRQLVEGVRLCHQMGVCHRDLKPENLLLDSQGNLKISDFGLSNLYVTGNESNNGTVSSRAELLHTTCGTPNYVAPEILKDESYDGRAADIWSMGVILFVLVSGCLPFDEPTLTSLFCKIQSAEYKVPPFLSESVQDLISTILVSNPEERASTDDIISHPWYLNNNVSCKCSLRDECDPINTDKDLIFGENNSVKTSWVRKSSIDLQDHREVNLIVYPNVDETFSIFTNVLDKMKFDITVMEHLNDSKKKMKAYRLTSKGIIGVTIAVSECDNAKDETYVEIRRGKGDIMVYNALLNELLKKRLLTIIKSILTAPHD